MLKRLRATSLLFSILLSSANNDEWSPIMIMVDWIGLDEGKSAVLCLRQWNDTFLAESPRLASHHRIVSRSFNRVQYSKAEQRERERRETNFERRENWVSFPSATWRRLCLSSPLLSLRICQGGTRERALLLELLHPSALECINFIPRWAMRGDKTRFVRTSFSRDNALPKKSPQNRWKGQRKRKDNNSVQTATDTSTSTNTRICGVE